MSWRGRGSTRSGLPAALPESSYEAPPLVEDTTNVEHGRLVVRVEGEDGRSWILPVDQLPLPGWHQPLAAALAARTGPGGGRRTVSSTRETWSVVGRLLRFLATLPEPPVGPAQLTVPHMEAFHDFRTQSTSELAGSRDLREFRLVVEHAPLRGQVPTKVVEYLSRRMNRRYVPQPGYSDREFGDLVAAARSDAANIRDRIRAGERLVARYETDPASLDETERERAAVLSMAAREGRIPAIGGPVAPKLVQRLEIARGLFLTLKDMPALLTLFIAVTGRNVETIKELPVEHRVLENQAVELRVVKRRRGARRWYETVTWEIGKPGRELHTPGGFYLLVHELTARSRAFSDARFLWSIWRNGHKAHVSGVEEHYGSFDKRLDRPIYASAWAAGHGITADQPSPPPDKEEAEGAKRAAAPLSLDFNRLKTSVDVRRTRQMGGHLPSSIRTNTIPVLFANYLRGDPTTIEWAHEVVSDALADAEQSALAAHQRALDAHGGSLRVVPGPADAEHLEQAGLDADTARKAANGELDTAWTGCVDHDHHPATGQSCRASFLDCFHCGNCLVTRKNLPRLLGLLDALADRRHHMSEDDWWERYGTVWAAIRKDVLVKFSPAEIEQAEAVKPDDALLDLIENPWERP